MIAGFDVSIDVCGDIAEGVEGCSAEEVTALDGGRVKSFPEASINVVYEVMRYTAEVMAGRVHRNWISICLATLTSTPKSGRRTLTKLSEQFAYTV